jgi:hypothetical protein
MAEFKNVTVRCPMELVFAVETLLERRRVERPYELTGVGTVFRELLARGLEVVAAESVARGPETARGRTKTV